MGQITLCDNILTLEHKDAFRPNIKNTFLPKKTKNCAITVACGQDMQVMQCMTNEFSLI